jgi:flagellar biosynthesis component FlhA
MAFRLFLGVWALHSVVYDSAGKAFVTLLVLACFNGIGETVFASLAIIARIKAQAEEERLRQEEIRKLKEARAQALAQAQTASAEKYYEFGMKGGAAQKPAEQS